MIRIGLFVLLTRFVIVGLCVYHSFLEVLIRFHASNSIRYDAQIFVAVRTLSPRFVPVH